MSLYLYKSKNVEQHILKRLLKRYQAGTAGKAERFIVDRWYDSFDSEPPMIPGIADQLTSEETASRIFSKIKTKAPASRNYFSPVLKIAASLLLVSALVFLFHQPRQPAAHLSTVIFRTEKGQIKKILLADSTRVWLNANSILQVLPGFQGAYRKVKLEGEAYFEVKHDTKRPFIIASSELNTQVLGTSFNISAYHQRDKIKVTVNTGKVSVSRGGNLLGMLNPGRAIQYNKGDRSIMLSDEDPELLTAWRSGRTLLNNASFTELSETFNNTFNVELSSADKNIHQLQFRLTLDRNLSVDENLKLISGIHQLKFRRTKNNGIEIYR
jgi:transmembrane sensor